PPGSHHRPGAHHRDRNRVLAFPQNAGGTAEKESLVAFRASTELSRGRDSGRRPFLGAPSRLSSDRTGGSVISTLEEKDSYDVGGAKSDGHGGAESSCQKHLARTLAAGGVMKSLTVALLLFSVFAPAGFAQDHSEDPWRVFSRWIELVNGAEEDYRN